MSRYVKIWVRYVKTSCISLNTLKMFEIKLTGPCSEEPDIASLQDLESGENAIIPCLCEKNGQILKHLRSMTQDGTVSPMHMGVISGVPGQKQQLRSIVASQVMSLQTRLISQHPCGWKSSPPALEQKKWGMTSIDPMTGPFFLRVAYVLSLQLW